jgi:hypothetical protein
MGLPTLKYGFSVGFCCDQAFLLKSRPLDFETKFDISKKNPKILCRAL